MPKVSDEVVHEPSELLVPRLCLCHLILLRQWVVCQNQVCCKDANDHREPELVKNLTLYFHY